MLAKCLLVVTGAEAKEERITLWWPGGGDRGGFYAVRLLWQQHDQEEDWGFLLIDAYNVLNE